jgi:hypothetical protein
MESLKTSLQQFWKNLAPPATKKKSLASYKHVGVVNINDIHLAGINISENAKMSTR